MSAAGVLDRLHRLSQLSVSDGKAAPALAKIVRAGIYITEADFGNIQVLSPRTNELRIVHACGLPHWWVDFWNDSRKGGKGACGAAAERQERVIVEDIERSHLFAAAPALEIMRKAGIRAVQSTPLFNRLCKLVGVFSTHYKTPRRPKTQALRFLDLLARQAADIIGQLQAREALERSESNFKELLKSMSVGFLSLETVCGKTGRPRDIRYLDANPAFERQTGLKTAIILGRTYREMFPASESPWIERFCKVAHSGEPAHYKESFGMFDRLFDISAYRTGPGRVSVLFIDVTEAHRAQERFQLAIEASLHGMIMVDGEGQIVLSNSRVQRMFGYSREELLGMSVDMLGPASWRSAHAAHRRNYNSDPQTRPMGQGRDLFGQCKDGRQIPIEISLSPIRSGSENYVLAAVADVTEMREMRRKLAQSEAMAAVGSMAAAMAHEIRNPLSSIRMAARSLRDREAAGEDRRLISSILCAESERLGRLLQDFVRYARPREPQVEPADLNRQVAEIVRILKSEEGISRGVEFETSLDRRLRPFPYDQNLIRQVLWNLLLNAIQAMDGNGRLRISTKEEEGKASLCIVDSGPGIAQESAGRIFEPFYTTKKDGSGLGLAVSQRIVHAHGGMLLAENEPGAGARFRVLLPIRPGEERAAEPANPK